VTVLSRDSEYAPTEFGFTINRFEYSGPITQIAIPGPGCPVATPFMMIVDPWVAVDG
jgi:hypothetical protein